VEAIQRALEQAGVIFIEAKDGGPGAKLGSGSPTPTAMTVEEVHNLRERLDELRKRLNRLTDRHGYRPGRPQG
jgi:hypothetical protein